MGQFLDFSDDHSSLVVNVKNLRTSYVSPLFYVVFEHIFQTIFSSGDKNMVVDAICNQLFESNQDVYAEDDFGIYGELIYFPPPLDQFWLSKPEHQDRREKMHAQCC